MAERDCCNYCRVSLDRKEVFCVQYGKLLGEFVSCVDSNASGDVLSESSMISLIVSLLKDKKGNFSYFWQFMEDLNLFHSFRSSSFNQLERLSAKKRIQRNLLKYTKFTGVQTNQLFMKIFRNEIHKYFSTYDFTIENETKILF